MRILFCGDIVGRSGRKAVIDALPDLRRRLELDFIAINGENAAHGFGVTVKMCKEFYAAGADAITTGNHVWNKREIMDYIGGDQRLLRPLNYPKDAPGRGLSVLRGRSGQKILVMHLLGRLFMEQIADPFAAAIEALAEYRLGETVQAIIVDIHAEATSEKMAMAHALDGQVSMVVGTHTHIPTADAQILPGGTAYLTDVGMCGDYDSVIGMGKKTAISRFTSQIKEGHLEPAEGEATLCAVYVETDDKTGLARRIAPLRMGGKIAPCWP